MFSCLSVVGVGLLAVVISALPWNHDEALKFLSKPQSGWTIYYDNRTAVEILNFSTPIGILSGEYCFMYSASNVRDSLLTSIVATKKEVSSKEMDDLVTRCEEIQEKNMKNGTLILQLLNDLPEGILRRLVIFPGTKWCGAGNIARNESDLGSSRKTDACCREHDMCPDNIAAGETKHNLTNDGHYTKSNCSCDDKFYQCLQDANTFTADSVGTLYFNVLVTECFTYAHPLKCVDRSIPLIGACTKYEEDTSEPKEWQFIPPKKYESSSNETDTQ